MDNIFIYNFVLLVYNEGNNIWREEMNEYPVEPCHTEDIIEDFKYTLTEGECT